MKVIAFNGSARKDGNTAILLRRVLNVLQSEGFETELIQLAGQQIHGCTACRTCIEAKDEKCVIVDDKVNDYIQKIKGADAILLGSPTYFAMMSPEMKALIDRIGYVARANPKLLSHKVGAAIVAVRRAGGITTFDAINHLFLISEMIVPGSSYWNIGIGNKQGDVEQDKEGMETMDTLGRNISWLLKKLRN